MSSLLATARVARELTFPRVNFGRGVQGFAAKRVQEWLSLHGFRCAVDGDFGPATEAALRLFQKARGLEVDGRASHETLTALTLPLRMAFAYETETTSLRDAAVLVAKRHLLQHPREVGGDNRGPWVRAYCGADGAPYAWCAGCVTSLVAQAAAMRDEPTPVPYTLGCDEISDHARKAGRLTADPARVRPGDLFLLRRAKNPADRFHTGMVIEMHVDHFHTIEGNTNDEGSANGYEMATRTRALNSLVEFVRLG